jgi:hypothetical protein
MTDYKQWDEGANDMAWTVVRRVSPLTGNLNMRTIICSEAVLKEAEKTGDYRRLLVGATDSLIEFLETGITTEEWEAICER